MLKIYKKLSLKHPDRRRGQSLLELALVLPILILMLLGLVEVSFFIGRYLDLLDLTREAARFGSVRDPFTIVYPVSGNLNCSDANQFFFYYTTSCIFSPPSTPDCLATNDPFCNGVNAFVDMDFTQDDIVITVFTVDGANHVSDTWPKNIDSDGNTIAEPYNGNSIVDEGGNVSWYWAYSEHDADTTNNGNWKKDCKGNVVRSHPLYTKAYLQNITANVASSPVVSTSGAVVVSPASKGFVGVEVYHCYSQILNLPVLTTFVPNPLLIHAYTLMSLPAAAPTATPLP